jgi:adenosylhomocysteine nucleosidase
MRTPRFHQTMWQNAARVSNLTNLGSTGIRVIASTRFGVSMLALLGAFGYEIADLRRQMVVDEIVANPVCRVYRGQLKGKDCLLVQTGMGKDRAEKATNFILQSYTVNTIISLGFAAALTPQLRGADVVVCSTLHCATGSEAKGQGVEAYASDAHLLSLASQTLGGSGVSSCIGSSVGVLRLHSSPTRIQDLGDAFHAQVADMESYWIAGIASAHRIPFIAIRSVSETMHDSVEPFDQILTSDGRLLWKRALPCFLLHPWYLMNVLAMFRRVRPARRNLAIFVSELVARI